MLKLKTHYNIIKRKINNLMNKMKYKQFIIMVKYHLTINNQMNIQHHIYIFNHMYNN